MNVPKLRFKEFNDEWRNFSLDKLVSFSKGNLLSKADLDESGLYSCILYGQLYTKYSEVIRTVDILKESNATKEFFKQDNPFEKKCIS